MGKGGKIYCFSATLIIFPRCFCSDPFWPENFLHKQRSASSMSVLSFSAVRWCGCGSANTQRKTKGRIYYCFIYLEHDLVLEILIPARNLCCLSYCYWMEWGHPASCLSTNGSPIPGERWRTELIISLNKSLCNNKNSAESFHLSGKPFANQLLVISCNEFWGNLIYHYSNYRKALTLNFGVLFKCYFSDFISIKTNKPQIPDQPLLYCFHLA